MVSKLTIVGTLFILLLSGCVKHDVSEVAFEPISEFSGRLLVMNKSKRFQTEIDWLADDGQGSLRLTHSSSGRVVDVQWKNKKMIWRDNKQSVVWHALSQKELFNMGVILLPWELSRVFSGAMPDTMITKDQRNWKGIWGASELTIRWASDLQRVELFDIKNGRRAVVVFDD